MVQRSRPLPRPSTLRRALVGAASALALVACAGGETEQMTASDGDSASTSTSSMTSASTSLATTSVTAGVTTSDGGTTDGGTSDATTSDSGTSGATTDDTTSASSDSATTDATTSTSGDTDTDTDTGVGVCEAAAWEVPAATEAELAAHDLQWVPCEMTVCGPDDADPGQALLCADFALDGVPLEYLGLLHPNDSGAFTTDDVVSADSVAWLNSERHTYRYDDSVYILTEGDEALDQLDVYFTVRALETLRLDHPAAYQALIVSTEAFPEGPTLDGLAWKNRHRSFIISFDTSPLYIAAGLTVLDKAPVDNKMEKLDEYSNVPAISIDRETILGVDDKIGSRPIYQKPGDDENFLRYAREGLADTLLHELLHRYIDRLNSVDAAMNDLYNRRVDPDACAKWELEETLVAAASLLHFRKAGGIGDAYLDYYDVVLDANLEIVKQCPDYAMWAETFASPSGVDPRYDLRLLDLE
ncbi:MAG: hypothetical protein KC486_27910 [Myxococcales bacterium]|nr:hypothetical protein [Myxococcales bacterium]